MRSRFAKIEERDDGIRFGFLVSSDLTLGSRVRAKELRQLVGRLVRNAKPIFLAVEEDHVSAMFDRSEPEARMRGLMSEVARRVDEFRKERLHPRVVDELLGISPRERRRWIKDGRLPVSGSGSFRRGKQVIQFPLHPPDEIARLLEAPGMIAEWRERDIAESGDIDPRSPQVPD